MLDRTIPYRNILMRCDRISDKPAALPAGFQIRSYLPGDEAAWARIERGIGDFNTEEDAKNYFLTKYWIKREWHRCLFVVSEQGEVVGSCIAWRDPKGEETVASLHWLVVSPAFEGRGIGTALLTETMKVFAKKREMPVYLHTQPWSYRAVALYHRYGFRLLKKESFFQYENQFEEAVLLLKPHLPEKLFQALLKAAV